MPKKLTLSISFVVIACLVVDPLAAMAPPEHPLTLMQAPAVWRCQALAPMALIPTRLGVSDHASRTFHLIYPSANEVRPMVDAHRSSFLAGGRDYASPGDLQSPILWHNEQETLIDPHIKDSHDPRQRHKIEAQRLTGKDKSVELVKAFLHGSRHLPLYVTFMFRDLITGYWPDDVRNQIDPNGAYRVLVKSNVELPGGHASDRGVHLFTRRNPSSSQEVHAEAKILLHEFGAFLGLDHLTNVALEIALEEWPSGIPSMLRQIDLSAAEAAFETRVATPLAKSFLETLEYGMAALDTRDQRPPHLLRDLSRQEIKLKVKDQVEEIVASLIRGNMLEAQMNFYFERLLNEDRNLTSGEHVARRLVEWISGEALKTTRAKLTWKLASFTDVELIAMVKHIGDRCQDAYVAPRPPRDYTADLATHEKLLNSLWAFMDFQRANKETETKKVIAKKGPYTIVSVAMQPPDKSPPGQDRAIRFMLTKNDILGTAGLQNCQGILGIVRRGSEIQAATIMHQPIQEFDFEQDREKYVQTKGDTILRQIAALPKSEEPPVLIAYCRWQERMFWENLSQWIRRDSRGRRVRLLLILREGGEGAVIGTADGIVVRQANEKYEDPVALSWGDVDGLLRSRGDTAIVEQRDLEKVSFLLAPANSRMRRAG